MEQMKENAQTNIGFSGIILFFVLVSIVSAQEMQENQANLPENAENIPEITDTPPEIPVPSPAIEPTGLEVLPEQEVQPEQPQTITDPALIVEKPDELPPGIGLKIISPIYDEKLSGTGIVIAFISPADKIIEAFFEIGGIRKELTAEKNFSEEFDSTILPNGLHELKASACIEGKCVSESVPVQISNEALQMPEVPTIVLPEQVLVKGSNIFSTLTLFNADGGIKASGTGEISVEKGIYDARVDFFGLKIKTIKLEQTEISSGTTLAQVEPLSGINSEPFAEPVSQTLHGIKITLGARTGKMAADLTELSDKNVFYCSQWNQSENSCAAEWHSAILRQAIENPKEAVVFAWKEKEKEPPEKEKFMVLPANIPFTGRVFDESQNHAASGEGEIELQKGVYYFELLFSNDLFQRAEINGVAIGKSGVLFEYSDLLLGKSLEMPSQENEEGVLSSGGFSENSDSNWPLSGFERLFEIKINYEISGGSVKPSNELFKQKVFRCNEFDFEKKQCLKNWERAIELNLVSGSNVFAIRKGMQNIPKEIKGKKMLVSLPETGFAANDLPQVEVLFFDEKDEPVDSEFSAFISLPDGTIEPGPLKVSKKETGKFIAFAHRPRNFRPGTYSITVDASENGSSLKETILFEWGLIAVNTLKSIYQPGELAEFQIVVLDRQSFGVKGAKVELSVLSPLGNIEVLSTENGQILETTSPGVYVSSLPVREEGTYNVEVHALAPQIDTVIKTTFDVRQEYPFDIFRNTATKIDPKVQPIIVQLKLFPFQSNAKTVNVIETVPKEFEILTGGIKEEYNEEGELNSFWEEDPRATIIENDGEKLIEWKNVEIGKGTVLEYRYKVPDKKPWLYLLGPLEINEAPTVFDSNDLLVQKTNSFFEARSWMVAVDDNPTGILRFRNSSVDGNAPVESMPNDGNCGTGCGISAYVGSVTPDTNGISDLAGSTSYVRVRATGTSYGVLEHILFISRPLAPQTITANGTWEGGMKCFIPNTTDNTSRVIFAIYRWQQSGDTNGERITNFFNTEVCTNTSAMKSGTIAGNFSSITFARGDKIVVEADINVSSTDGVPTSRNFTMTFNHIDTADSNILLPSGVTLRFAGDLNTGIVAPVKDFNTLINTAFDVNVRGSCSYYSCGDTNVTLQYCINPAAGCATFFDMNTDSSSPLYVSSGPAFRRDDLLNEWDINWFVFQVTGTDDENYTIRSKIDSNWSADINYSNLNAADVNITINKGRLTFVVNHPPADANTTNADINFLVSGVVACNDHNCGAVDTNLQYCNGAGCSGFLDINNATGSPLQLMSGSIPDQNSDMNVGQTYDVNWFVKGNVAGTYELRLRGKGATTDFNTTSGTDRTITISAVAADYSFALLLPSSGCNEGNGSWDAGGTCDRGYFQTTDLTGTADQTKVDAEGQTSTIPFFVYDNQSTTSSDLNITLDLNAPLPSTLRLKVSKIYNGWAQVCTGNTDTNCAQIDENGNSQYQIFTPTEDLFLSASLQDAPSDSARIYMKFNISSISSSAGNIDANLQMYVEEDSDDDDYAFYHLDQNQGWTESDSTANIYAMRTGLFLPVTGCYAGTGDKNCSITSIVQASFNARDYNFSLRMEDPDANNSAPIDKNNSQVLVTANAEGVTFKRFSSSEKTNISFTVPTLFVKYDLNAVNIGTATYSAGTQDLNIFVWGDFVSAGVGSVDRNAISTSKSPT